MLTKKVETVGGVDVAYTDACSVGAAVVLDYDSLQLQEEETAVCKTCLPYIPTLLSFREIPPVVAAVKKLRAKPDMWLVDGQGYAHPFRLGFASHLGLVLNAPTIGVAKSILCGKVEAFDSTGVASIIDKDEVVGAAVLTTNSRRPVYVSVGHMVSLATAINIVKHCAHCQRVPKPIQMAHAAAFEAKRKLQNAKPAT